MDTKIDLDELERLANAATPGPWRVESEVVRDSMGLFWPISSIEGTEDNVTENVTTGDAAYIVAACNAVPELIAKVRELERQRDWLASQHAKACLDAANDACVWNTGDCPVCPLDKGVRCLEVTSKTFIEAAEKATKEAEE